MATWRYIKGSEKDFESFSDKVFATFKVKDSGVIHGVYDLDDYLTDDAFVLIAQRERVTSINDDRLAQDMGLNPKYNRPCKGVTIDVYDVLQAFNVINPALQHLVKKALAVGQRGHKDKMEDLRDILASAQRAIELEEYKE